MTATMLVHLGTASLAQGFFTGPFRQEKTVIKTAKITQITAPVKVPSPPSSNSKSKQDEADQIEGRIQLEMAEAQCRMKNWPSAFHFWDEALKLQEASYGPRHPIVAQTLVRRGKGYANLAQWYQATLDLERAVHIQKESMEKSRADKAMQEETADSLVELGRVLYGMNRFAEALSSMEQSLSLRQEVHGRHHARVAQTYCVVGDVHRQQRNYDLAHDSYKAALKCYKLGGVSKNRPDVVWTKRRMTDRNMLGQRFWSRARIGHI